MTKSPKKELYVRNYKRAEENGREPRAINSFSRIATATTHSERIAAAWHAAAADLRRPSAFDLDCRASLLARMLQLHARCGARSAGRVNALDAWRIVIDVHHHFRAGVHQ